MRIAIIRFFETRENALFLEESSPRISLQAAPHPVSDYVPVAHAKHRTLKHTEEIINIVVINYVFVDIAGYSFNALLSSALRHAVEDTPGV
jgi:hypothetical protein